MTDKIENYWELAESGLPINFREMGTQGIIHNRNAVYFFAQDLLKLSGGQEALEARTDEEAQRIMNAIGTFQQYEESTNDYLIHARVE